MKIIADKTSKTHIKNRNLIIENSDLSYCNKIAKPLRELALDLNINYFCIDSELIPELKQINTSYCFLFDYHGCKIQDIVILIDSLKQDQEYLKSDLITALNAIFCHELGHLLNYFKNDRSESSANLISAKLMSKYQLCNHNVLLRILHKTLESWKLERC